MLLIFVVLSPTGPHTTPHTSILWSVVSVPITPHGAFTQCLHRAGWCLGERSLRGLLLRLLFLLLHTRHDRLTLRPSSKSSSRRIFVCSVGEALSPTMAPTPWSGVVKSKLHLLLWTLLGRSSSTSAALVDGSSTTPHTQCSGAAVTVEHSVYVDPASPPGAYFTQAELD